MNKSKATVVHMDMQGTWFTWFLRHLWVEGSELKAVKTWQSAFPDLCSIENLKDLFLPIVSGKKKFTGMASGKGFGFEDDNVKFWDADQSGKENKAFPLLNSWEDVILLKKVKLFVSELELRWFKVNRRLPSTFPECTNSIDWIQATEENKVENQIRKEVNTYWTEIRNITIQSGIDGTLEMLPTDEFPLQTGPTGLMKKDRKTINQCQTAYDNIMKVLEPIEKYFRKKYNMSAFHELTIRKICEIPDYADYLEPTPAPVKVAKQSLSSTYIPDATTIALGMYGVNVNVNKFIDNMLEDSNRNRTDPEDISTTKWTSGYIDREGRFYGCADICHGDLSKDLCDHFGFKGKKEKDREPDSQIILDEKGWVKISMNRFFWDVNKKLLDEQKSAMFDYMSGKKITKALFNTTIPMYAKTLAEELNEGEHE